MARESAGNIALTSAVLEKLTDNTIFGPGRAGLSLDRQTIASPVHSHTTSGNTQRLLLADNGGVEPVTSELLRARTGVRHDRNSGSTAPSANRAATSSATNLISTRSIQHPSLAVTNTPTVLRLSTTIW